MWPVTRDLKRYVSSSTEGLNVGRPANFRRSVAIQRSNCQGSRLYHEWFLTFSQPSREPSRYVHSGYPAAERCCRPAAALTLATLYAERERQGRSATELDLYLAMGQTQAERRQDDIDHG